MTIWPLKQQHNVWSQPESIWYIPDQLIVVGLLVGMLPPVPPTLVLEQNAEFKPETPGAGHDKGKLFVQPVPLHELQSGTAKDPTFEGKQESPIQQSHAHKIPDPTDTDEGGSVGGLVGGNVGWGVGGAAVGGIVPLPEQDSVTDPYTPPLQIASVQEPQSGTLVVTSSHELSEQLMQVHIVITTGELVGGGQGVQ